MINAAVNALLGSVIGIIALLLDAEHGGMTKYRRKET